MMKKRKITVCLLCGVLLCAVGLLVYSARIIRYQNAADYTAHGGRLPFEIPDAAEDCRFVTRNLILSRLYLYAFRLSPEKSSEYIDALCAAYRLDSEDENDRQYSYAHWYHMPVADAQTGDPLMDFPVHLPFDTVTERSITEAEIIVYYPVMTGGRTHGVVVFPDTGEFVCFEYLSR